MSGASIVPLGGDPSKTFESEPDRSFTLPGRYYFDPEIFAAEMPAIMYRNWIYAGHISSLANAGDYMVRDIGDQSVMILRDRNGDIVAYHNVCQHRAHRLLENEGRIKTLIVCPYHSWSYDLSGELKRIPGEEQALGLEKGAFCLHPVRVEVFLGFVFFNLDPDAAPITQAVAGMEKQFRSFCAEPEKLKRAYVKEYDVQANWKNVIENYSECYHCPVSHPTLSQNALDMTDYRIEVFDGFHHHNSGDRGDMQGYKVENVTSPRGDEFGGWYVFPLTSFEFYPGGKLTVFHNLPTGPETTHQRIEWYLDADEPTPEEQDVIDFIDVVRREDFPLVESVQRGLHSQGYGQGRFVVDEGRTYLSEHAVHDFQRRVLSALGN
ncbi:MAG: aromatic ring-hydroxylating dioxygenase subunit alpha [Rhodospirillales bacterium]